MRELFVLAAIALTAGLGYAAIIAVAFAFCWQIGAWWIALVQAHGHAQLFGCDRTCATVFRNAHRRHRASDALGRFGTMLANIDATGVLLFPAIMLFADPGQSLTMPPIHGFILPTTIATAMRKLSLFTEPVSPPKRGLDQSR